MNKALEECAHLGKLNAYPLECGLCATSFLLAALLSPPWPTAPLLLVACFAILLYAGLSFRYLIRLVSIPLGFLVLSALSLSISPTWQQGFHFVSSPEQRLLAFHTVLRSFSACGALLLLTGTVPIHRLGAFLRWLHLPPEVVDLFFIMYRTIALLAESWKTLSRAQENRLGNRSFRIRLRSAGIMSASLFILAQQKAKAMEMGLAARGYQGNLPVWTKPPHWHPLGILIALMLPGALTALGFFLELYAS